ncbi:transposase [Secundilactobacillus malefermentans]|uniref:transposase n=1 Tax=Secundilactobacillus malefermentans TaxID=176292 RepID=UPI0016509AAF|nr:transposase [Secundilactobacillus malefermentans]
MSQPLEPVFGNLKANLAFKRLSVRGLEKAKNELGIILMAGNLKKMMKIILSSRQQSQKSSWKNLVNKFFQLLFYSEVSFVPATFLFGYHAVEAVGSELPFMSGS